MSLRTIRTTYTKYPVSHGWVFGQNGTIIDSLHKLLIFAFAHRPTAVLPYPIVGSVKRFHNMGDVNYDLVIDDADLALLQAQFGKTEADPDFDPNCDLNGDGVVDILDVAVAGKNYGMTYPDFMLGR